jgi:GNAT superfamily N-acetyltransferase
VPAVIGRVRRWFAAHERDEFTWWVTSSSLPTDLRDRLEEAGARRDERSGEFVSLVLRHAPPSVAGVRVRRVQTFEDFVAVRRVAEQAFTYPATQSDELREAWDVYRRQQAAVGFLALIDDEPVASAGAIFLESGATLFVGGATARHARGRGAYRALVRARWDLTTERGSGLVVTHANPVSLPILERLGFETAGWVSVLSDSSSFGGADEVRDSKRSFIRAD